MLDGVNSWPAFFPVIFEQTHIFHTRIALEVHDASPGHQAQELPRSPHRRHSTNAGRGNWILNQHLMRAHRMHAVIDAIAAAARLAFNAIQRRRMHHRARRPWRSRIIRSRGDYLHRVRGIAAKWAGPFGSRRIDRIVSGNNPRACDRIFAKFHRQRRTPPRTRVNMISVFSPRRHVAHRGKPPDSCGASSSGAEHVFQAEAKRVCPEQAKRVEWDLLLN